MPSPLVRLVHPASICPLPSSDWSILRVYALSPRPIGPLRKKRAVAAGEGGYGAAEEHCGQRHAEDEQPPGETPLWTPLQTPSGPP
eukprot:1182901-Prorocentrum_minimum.AAC.1